MTITRIPVPEYLRWPITSTRILIPTIALRGFWGHNMVVTFAFWKWRVDFQLLPGSPRPFVPYQKTP